MKKLLCCLAACVLFAADCDVEVQEFDFSKTCTIEQEDSEFIKAINEYRQNMGLNALKSKPSSDEINTSVVTSFNVNKYETLDLTLKAVLSNVSYKQVLFASFYDSVCFEEDDKTIKILLYSDKINKECSKDILYSLINKTQSSTQVVRGLCNAINKQLDVSFLPKQSSIVFVGKYNYIVKDGELLGYPISVWGGDDVKIYQNGILVDTNTIKSTKVNENFFEIYPKDLISGDFVVAVDDKKYDFFIQKPKNHIFIDIKNKIKKTVYLKKDDDFIVVLYGKKDYKIKLTRENKNYDIQVLSDKQIKIHSSKTPLDTLELMIDDSKISFVVLENGRDMGVFYDNEKKILQNQNFIQNGFFIE